MRVITLKRIYLSDRTLGDLILDDGSVIMKTQELPWLDNQVDVSCIPERSYPALRYLSSHLGWVYRLKGTDPREDIDIHSGNFTAQIKGCIEVGDKYGEINGEFAILDSKNALEKLFDYAGEEFILNITS